MGGSRVKELVEAGRRAMEEEKQKPQKKSRM